jgi:hypothetical protein
MQLLERSEQLDKLTGVKAVTLFTLLARAGLARLTDNLERMAALANQILALLPLASDLNEWQRKWLKVTALQRLSVCAMDLGDRPQLAALTEQMVPLFKELGDQEALLCLFLNQGDAALYDGDIKQASEFLNHGLTYGTGQGTFFEQCVNHKLGIIALHNGEPEKARAGYIGWIKFLHTNYGFWNVAEGLWGLANLAIGNKVESRLNFWGRLTTCGNLLLISCRAFITMPMRPPLPRPAPNWTKLPMPAPMTKATPCLPTRPLHLLWRSLMQSNKACTI